LVTALAFDTMSYLAMSCPGTGFGSRADEVLSRFGVEGECRFFTAVCARDFSDLDASPTLYDGASFFANWMLMSADLLTTPGEVVTGSPYAPPGRVDLTLGGKSKFQALLDFREDNLKSADTSLHALFAAFDPQLYIYAGALQDIPSSSDPLDTLTFFCNYFPATLITRRWSPK